MHNYQNISWQRPKTTKLYLHPPRCERIYTLWREGKIIMGENRYPRDIATAAINENMPCSGLWVVHSRHARVFDFKNATIRTPENGTPIHAVTSTFGGLEMDMEAFCNTERAATCFVKITVTNRAPLRAAERLGIIVRTGKERQIVYGAPDGYCSHAPEASAFKYTTSTFVKNGDILRDGMVFLGVRTQTPYTYQEGEGILWFKEWLAPGEHYEILLCFGKGECAPMDFDYEAEKQKVMCYWEKQLQRLVLPAAIANDKEKLHLAKNFAVQIMQCYAHYVGKDFLVPRQGSMQRYVWPWDQYPVLEAISRMGDFAEFYRGAIDTYFEQMQRPSGEICTFGENWAQDTCCALISFAAVCLNANDRALWEKHCDGAYAAFSWIRNKRWEARGQEGCVDGLFPPMRGSDWPQVFQNWHIDRWNLLAMEKYATAAAHFGDPRADEIRAEHDEYLRIMREAFAKAVEPQKGLDTLHIPLMPIGDDRAMIEEEFYPYMGHGVALYSGMVDEKDIPRVLKCMEKEGISSGHGLYGHMPYPDGNMHIWYTTAPELYMYHTFRRIGDHKAAEQVVNALLHCTVTEECYVCERIADNDPWYVPWLPNASGMGRLLWMMLDSCNY